MTSATTAAPPPRARPGTPRDVYSALCPCRAVLDLLADRWSALAIGALEDGPRRFGAVQRRLQGVSPKVLTQTLRRLEGGGFVERTIIPAVPLHVEYALTALGRSAAVPLGQLRAWAEANVDRVAGLPPAGDGERAAAAGADRPRARRASPTA